MNEHEQQIRNQQLLREGFPRSARKGCMVDLRLLLVAIIWGVNFSVVKYSLAEFLPLSFTVIRFFLGALFLFGVLLLGREPLRVQRGDIPALARLGIIGIALYNIFFMEGLRLTTASHSALLISLSPLFAALIQAALGRERLSFRIAVGIALASAGVYLIINNRGALQHNRAALPGDLLTVVASMLWALYTLTAKPLLEKYPAVKVTAYSMAIGSGVLLPVSIPDLVRQQWGAVSALSWGGLAFAAFISGGIAFSLWYRGVKQIGVTRTIMYHYLVPLVAVLVAAQFLGERFAPSQALGAAAILTGVFLAQKKTAAERVRYH